MEFIGGLIGIKQDPTTLSLRPEIGWAIRESAANNDRIKDIRFRPDCF
jgi:hypothetical protein